VALMLMDWPKQKEFKLIWDWNHISTQHFVEGWFGKKYHGWCHQNGDTSLYPTCPSCCRLLACYPTVPQWISTRILPLIYGYKFMFCHHFQYSNIPRQIW
jgi:hypothetical protein